ncbi:hypothetical protein DSO57_1001894 [Entomophthora muscae]|uniref:Uncharacterized protein n=1 Tax=Entomophthora muscae TaxID=34485 RepID=A0ACC2TJY0_9FUNG|nr:hypothetical protein DSO57_1001894 [Entomophthora muscae]
MSLLTKLLPSPIGNNSKRLILSTFMSHSVFQKRTMLNKMSSHPKQSLLWWKDFTIVMSVFAVTGSASVYLTRPFISKGLGLEGSLKDGPWSYRLSYVLIGLPTYSAMLLAFGTLSGKGAYFQPIAKRMWTRFIPKRNSVQQPK